MGSRQEGRAGGREDGGTAPGGVEVEPHAVSLADGSEGFDGVVGAEDGGAGRGVQVKGGEALFFGLVDEGVEGGGIHAAGLGVYGNGADG